ncbi:hypothetical protein ACOWPS_20470 [Pseudomonas aeruginosa]|uniref:hypothetical protein n=1 Tax=Pseudomonas aeruginosa TaxID=287 RepID=UPI003BACEE3E
MSMELNKESVEQAGGDERAAFELFVRKHCGMPEHIAVNWDAKFTNDAWEGWQARAALAKPSPDAPYADGIAADLERSDWTPEDAMRWYAAGKHFDTVNGRTRIIDTGAVASNALKHLSLPYLEMKGDAELTELRKAMAQPSPTTDSRPAEWSSYDPTWVVDFIRDNSIFNADLVERMLEYATRPAGDVPQAEQAEQRLADWDEMRKERDAALAMVAEMERQEPVALANRGLHAFWVKWTEAAAGLYGPGIKLYAAPVAQAQQLHDLDKQCRDDVARALGLRPNQERGFAWSYLLASIKSCVKASGDSAQAQHSVPEGWMLVECGIWTQEQVDEMQKTVARFRNSEFVDDRALAMAVADAGQCKAPEISLAELLAAAPGKEGV